MRVIAGISGTTGPIYGIRLLEVLKKKKIESHLIITPTAEKIIPMETPYSIKDVKNLAHKSYGNDDLSAAISSGSFKTDGMVVIPCSIKSLSGIANSYNENLLIRASDVTLKERRRLVLVLRETPLHQGHFELMLRASRAGAVFLPPMPAFYFRPKTLDDLINHTVGKVLDLFGIEHDLFQRWGNSNPGKPQKRRSSRD